MSKQNNLAEPVRAQLDSDSRLLSADPPLMRLHLRSGGREDGPLAIPQLAEMCRLSKRLGMNLSRPVKAANEDSVIDMWVEIKLGSDQSDNGFEIAIMDWRESDAPVVDVDSGQRQRDFDRLNDRGSIRTDASLRVMSLFLPGDAGAAEQSVGRDLLDIFEFVPPSGKQELTDSIAERQPVRKVRLRQHQGMKSLYEVTGQPLIDSAGLYSGYRFSLEREKEQDPQTEVDASRKGSLIGESLFGAQLGPALRQPLGKIIANAETIGNQLVGPLRGNYADYANDIADAGRHLLALVDDLSDLEAIERDNFTVAVDDIDLVDLAHRAAGLLAVKAADHQMRIDVPSRDSEVPAQGEFRRVLQILVNLVGNAIRYSPDGSVVKIQVEAGEETVSVAVTDQGDGIAKEDQLRIFEKFERLGRSGDGGSGLGLFISRRLADAMNGHLTVESKIGHGTTFTLSLPARNK